MSSELKKTLKPIQLWAIIVGMVISGMYCGWNSGLAFTSPLGFIIAILVVTAFYTTFMFSYAELSTAIPHAGGPSEYASRAIGRFGGFVAGFACLVEFLFATPAIAIAAGAYINFAFPRVPSVLAAIVCYAIFVIINCIGVETAAKVEMGITVIAVLGIALFVILGITHVNIASIVNSKTSMGGIKGVYSAIPYAIWFYLAVEGGAMAAEECHNPKKDIPKSFIISIGTLVILAFLTFFVTAGVLDQKTLAGSASPLPDALGVIFGKQSIIPNVMSFIGLFGLVASIHGLIIGYSRQAFAMSRAGYLPKFLSKVSSKGVPVLSVVIPSLVGMVFVALGDTATIIVISSFGAIALYIISMVSLFVLRRKEPKMNRPYKVFYPLVPGIALVLALVFLVTVTMANLSTIAWVVGAFAVAILYHFIYSSISKASDETPVENNEEAI
ncbi:ethanolamine permease [Clostridium akagii]|uniref:ethanolamine permease n=1 Tax=Clostridium akagii TaxID=91623 RepID=UPI00047A59DA|nr:ethanolamine permease [Clostridium akagii]